MNLPTVVFSLTLVTQSVDIDPSVRDRFLRECPSAVAEIGSRMFPAKGDARVFDAKSGDGKRLTNRFVFAVDGARRKLEWTREFKQGKDPRVIRTVFSLDEKTSFRLKSVGASPYQIEAIGLGPVEKAMFWTIFGKYLDAPGTILGITPAGLISNPKLQISVAREIETGRGRVVEVRFDGKTGDSQPISYRARLDPRLSWAVLESERRMGSSEPELIEIEYHSGLPGGRIFPKRVKSRAGDGTEAICEFERIEFVSTPSAEFGMEHYGLKDVAQYATARSSPFWDLLGWGGIVVVLLVTSVALKRVINRLR